MTLTTEQRASLVEQLTTVRENLRTGTARYLEIATITKARRLAKENLRGRIKNADERISAHFNKRGRAFDFLPDDAESVAWSEERRRLEAERQALIDEIHSVNSEEFTFECVQFEGPWGLLATWQLTEGNLLAALERDADENRTTPWSRGEITAVH